MARYFMTLALLCAIGVATPVAAAGWIEGTRITEIVIEGAPAEPRVYLKLESNPNPTGCENDYLVRLGAGMIDSSKGQYMMSAAISAQVAGNPVRVSITGCDDWGRPSASSLWLQ